MKNESVWNAWFPDFVRAGEPALEKFINAAKFLELPAEQTVFQPGSQCANYYLLVSGSIRVFVLTPRGREVLLYRVQTGEGCVMTTSCLLGEAPYNVFAITDSSVTVIAVPTQVFHETITLSPTFRRFVFRGFTQRLANVLMRLEELMEGDIDQMLADFLIDHNQSGLVVTTHQMLADQIGTAREVVSRHLKRFEGEGWVQLSRGNIRLLNPDAIASYSKKKK